MNVHNFIRKEPALSANPKLPAQADPGFLRWGGGGPTPGDGLLSNN